jgi:hypothetical protein
LIKYFVEKIKELISKNSLLKYKNNYLFNKILIIHKKMKNLTQIQIMEKVAATKLLQIMPVLFKIKLLQTYKISSKNNFLITLENSVELFNKNLKKLIEKYKIKFKNILSNLHSEI